MTPVPYALAILLAIALQIQATLPLSGPGIRVSLADLLLPVAVLVYLRQMPIRAGAWIVPGVPYWLVALSAVMTLALAVGYWDMGRLSAWAVVNKYFGWFTLAAYLMIAGALVRMGGRELRDQIVRVFVAFAIGVAAVNVLAMPILYGFYTLPVGIEFDRATGLMKNSNAFGFLLVVALLLGLAATSPKAIALVPLLSALWFTGSRGAVLALFAGLVTLAILEVRRLRPLLVALPIAAAVIAAIVLISTVAHPQKIKRALSGNSPIGFLSQERLSSDGATVNERKAQTLGAVELVGESPIFGSGLGSFLDRAGTTLHNSLLWLLVETGAIGALIFSAFLALCLWTLYRNKADPLRSGMIAVSAAFMAISVTGEFLYQRHLWFLLGLTLVAADREKINR